MQTQVFEEIPDLTDLMPHGGRPGFEYAIISCSNVIQAQRDGWAAIDRINAFEIVGPKGSCPAMLVGKGDAIYGASPLSMRMKAWYDPEITKVTGLVIEVEDEPVAVVPVAVQSPKAAVTAQAIIKSQQPAPVAEPKAGGN